MRTRLLMVFLTCAALAAAAPAVAADECYRVVNVDAWDVLFIRSKRDHRSKAVGAIAPNHGAMIHSTGPCLPRGASRRRQWCPISYSPLPDVEKRGFVKAYFIEPATCQ